GKTEGAIADKTNIFACKNNHSPCNEFWVFARVDHSAEVIECCLDIAAAHALNERAYDVVVHIALFVVARNFFLGGGLYDIWRDLFTETKCELEVAKRHACISP